MNKEGYTYADNRDTFLHDFPDSDQSRTVFFRHGKIRLINSHLTTVGQNLCVFLNTPYIRSTITKDNLPETYHNQAFAHFDRNSVKMLRFGLIIGMCVPHIAGDYSASRHNHRVQF